MPMAVRMIDRRRIQASLNGANVIHDNLRFGRVWERNEQNNAEQEGSRQAREPSAPVDTHGDDDSLCQGTCNACPSSALKTTITINVVGFPVKFWRAGYPVQFELLIRYHGFIGHKRCYI